MPLISYTDEQINYLKDLRENQDLSWKEIVEEYNAKFGTDLGLNALRKTYKRWQGVVLSDDILVKSVAERQSARSTATKVRAENKALVDEILSQEEFLSQLTEINKSVPLKLHKKVKISKAGKIQRALVAHISDTHIGCNIHSKELGGMNEYNPEIAARRFALYFKTLAEYKVDHRKETELVLVCNGDIFAGVIHNQESVDPMSTQFASGLRIFAQGISYLAQHFKKIRVIGTTGNHDRYMHKPEKGRQFDKKWDSFTTNLYTSLRERFVDYRNISFEIPETPYALVDIMGHNVFVTHGDTVLDIGNPSKALNIDSITKQVNNFMTSLNKKIDLVMVGHVHKELFFALNNGAYLAVNGTLSGSDSFSQGIGYLSNRSCLQFFEMTPEYILGDMRFTNLTAADKDKSLEKIIEPLRGNF